MIIDDTRKRRSNLAAQLERLHMSGLHGGRALVGGLLSTDSQERDTLSGTEILLVEDEAVIAFELEIELADCEANVVGPASTLGMGIDLLERHSVDAAILDISLNGVDVYPLAEILLKRKIPFIFHTADGAYSELKHTYPNTPVCLKPCPPADILTSLRRRMSRPH